MRVVVAGGSGFIGSALVARLIARGDAVTILTRDAALAGRTLGSKLSIVQWNGTASGARSGGWETAIDGADAVVNLAGASIGAKRWSSSRKSEMIDSRIQSTHALIDAVFRARTRPTTFINASAVGYYGDVPDGDCDESHAAGNDFLASLCVQWEQEAQRVTDSGARLVVVRTGLVLAAHGGALARLLPIFKSFAGGPLGSGRQWWPWIHIDDEIGIIEFALSNSTVTGPINAASPSPVRMADMARALGRVLHRPAFMPAPAFALRLMLGEMADALLLGGQRAMPAKLLACGYAFRFTDAEQALRDLLAAKPVV